MKPASVALVRGNGMNSWEGRSWNDFPEGFKITGFCAKRNLYSVDDLRFPLVKLNTSTDNIILSKFNTFRGVFQKMENLENELRSFSIAHTVEIYNYYTYQAVLAKKINPNLKVITTVWDNSPGRFDQNFWGPFKRPKFITKKIKQIITDNASQVDRFIAVSKTSADLLKSEWGVSDEKVIVVTPGIAARELKSIERTDVVMKENSFMMVNRLRAEKGIYDVILAWKLFLQKTKLTDPSLVIIGDGQERKKMLKLIRDLNIEKTVQYYDNLPNDLVRSMYEKARTLILASVSTPLWREQFGYVIAEALSAGCPVIGTDSGSIPDIVGQGGIIIKENSPKDLAAAMLEMENEEKRSKYGLLAKQSSERFSMNIFKTQLIKIYSELL